MAGAASVTVEASIGAGAAGVSVCASLVEMRKPKPEHDTPGAVVESALQGGEVGCREAAHTKGRCS